MSAGEERTLASSPPYTPWGRQASCLPFPPRRKRSPKESGHCLPLPTTFSPHNGQQETAAQASCRPLCVGKRGGGRGPGGPGEDNNDPHPSPASVRAQRKDKDKDRRAEAGEGWAGGKARESARGQPAAAPRIPRAAGCRRSLPAHILFPSHIGPRRPPAVFCWSFLACAGPNFPFPSRASISRPPRSSQAGKRGEKEGPALGMQKNRETTCEKTSTEDHRPEANTRAKTRKERDVAR